MATHKHHHRKDRKRKTCHRDRKTLTVQDYNNIIRINLNRKAISRQGPTETQNDTTDSPKYNSTQSTAQIETTRKYQPLPKQPHELLIEKTKYVLTY